MAYERFVAIRSLAISNLDWTDVVGKAVLPIDCNCIVIFNNTGQDVKFRTDPAVAASEVPIASGQQFEVSGSRTPASAPRFPAGSTDPVGALQASASPVSVIIESTV